MATLAEQYKIITINYIQELTKQGFSAEYIESKSYQMYGNKVGLPFITEQVKIFTQPDWDSV